jgi:hypothetical protein
MVIPPPDSTTHPGAFGRRGATDEITGLNLQRNAEK